MELSKKQIFIGAGAIAAATGITLLAIAKKRRNKKAAIKDIVEDQLALTSETDEQDQLALTSEDLAVEENL